MNLRPATLADLPDLYALELFCFPGDAWSVTTLGAELQRPNALVLVVEEEGAVLGSAIAWWILDEMEILRVAVGEKARRRGVARRLLEGLETTISEVSTVFLEVREDNVAAIALYEGAGYQKSGRRKGYYQDGCDARLYRKALR